MQEISAGQLFSERVVLMTINSQEIPIGDCGVRKKISKFVFLLCLVSISIYITVFGQSSPDPGGNPVYLHQEPGNIKWRLERVAFLCLPYDFSVDGPALQALGSVEEAAFAPGGEIYFAGANTQNIFVLDRGRIYHLAGNGTRGFRDGLAGNAMFNFGRSGYRYVDIAVDTHTGSIYVADGLNKRIRKIFKDSDGKWVVSTFAGGGNLKLKLKETANATDVNLGEVVAVTVDNKGNVYTSPYGKIVKITPDGRATVVLEFPDDGYPLFRNVVNMDADNLGNIYGVARGSGIDGYFKYTKDGEFVRLTYVDRGDPKGTVDGPIKTSTYRCPTKVAVDPAGTVIYGGGADELCLRRIKDGKVSTLQKDGSWAESKVENQGWRLGSPRLVDEGGNIYISRTQMTGISLRKLTYIREGR